MIPNVSEGPVVRFECGNVKLLKENVHVIFYKASWVSQNREKGKLPVAPDWVQMGPEEHLAI